MPTSPGGCPHDDLEYLLALPRYAIERDSDGPPALPRTPKQGLTRDRVVALTLPPPRRSHSGVATTLLTYLVAATVALTVALAIGHDISAAFAQLTLRLP